MSLYIYEYNVLSTGEKNQLRIPAENQEEADAGIVERVADFEFTTEDDIEIIRMLKVIDDKDNYYECEGCT